MIADQVTEGIRDYLEDNAGATLSTAAFLNRNNGGDITYPAVIISEAGDPEEHDVLRGVWSLDMEVALVTKPETDPTAVTHEAMNLDLNCLLGDTGRIKSALSSRVQCWECWGGVGATEPEDGYRTTTFKLTAIAALAN